MSCVDSVPFWTRYPVEGFAPRSTWDFSDSVDFSDFFHFSYSDDFDRYLLTIFFFDFRVWWRRRRYQSPSRLNCAPGRIGLIRCCGRGQHQSRPRSTCGRQWRSEEKTRFKWRRSSEKSDWNSIVGKFLGPRDWFFPSNWKYGCSILTMQWTFYRSKPMLGKIGLYLCR